MALHHQQSMPRRPQVQHLALHADRNTIARIREMPALLLHADASGVEAMMPWLASCQTLYLLAGLGGRIGSVAAPALARLAQGAGLRTVALVTMPLAWEGRSACAARALANVRACASETAVFYGDAVAERLGDDAAIDEFLAQMVGGVLSELDARAGL